MTRAEHRLEIARGLLGLPPGADVMLVINEMPAQQRAELRAQVDWVEAYDNAS
jgi:hypothetical protein